MIDRLGVIILQSQFDALFLQKLQGTLCMQQLLLLRAVVQEMHPEAYIDAVIALDGDVYIDSLAVPHGLP